MTVSPSYYALRVCPRANAPQWWTSAHAAANSAPAPIRAILAGRERIEVSAEEATHALRWAEHVPGWDHDVLRPLWIYPKLASPTS